MLEKAVSGGTARRYRLARKEFRQFVRENFDDDEKIDTIRALDEALCDYVVHLFEDWSGRGQRQRAIDAKAGMVARHGIPRGQLPLTERALRAWDREVPGKSPPPLTRGLALLIAWHVREYEPDGHRLACCILVAFGAYLRISEVLSLRAKEVALPGDGRLADTRCAGLRMDAKTGRDQYVSVDDRQAIEALRWLKRHTRSGDRLCPYSYSQVRHMFNRTCEALGIGGCGFTLHSLRHGGATSDFARGVSIDTIALRGRWASSKSLHRYVQAGRARLLACALPDEVGRRAAVLARYPGLVWV